MKYTELKDLTPEELRTKEAELTDELFKLRLRQATTQLENPMRIRQLRRDIARIQTAQRALVDVAPTTPPAAGPTKAPAKGGS
jgi:large subunit ribosomal protein L29